MTTEILLIGHAGFWNRGCEAIVRGTLDIILRAIPDARITLVSSSVEADAKLIRQEQLPIAEVLPLEVASRRRITPAWLMETFVRKVLLGNMSQDDYRLRDLYRRSAIVISIGGDNFSDDYGSPQEFFDALVAAKRFGAKTVIWGASIGPFHQEATRWAAIMRDIDLITVREQLSLEYLQGLGVTGNVHRVADPAFVMSPTAPKVPNIQSPPEWIGIGISALIRRYFDSPQKHSALFVEWCTHLHRREGLGILLVPHVMKPGSPNNDDYAACLEVREKLPAEVPCIVLPPDLNACELKYCISRCQYFIGARTHSQIAALSTGVPTLSIGYSVKAFGINQDTLDTQKYVLPYEQLNMDSLKARFAELKADAPAIRARLNERKPMNETQAREAGRLLAALLEPQSRQAH